MVLLENASCKDEFLAYGELRVKMSGLCSAVGAEGTHAEFLRKLSIVREPH